MQSGIRSTPAEGSLWILFLAHVVHPGFIVASNSHHNARRYDWTDGGDRIAGQELVVVCG